jgi:ABC-type branched-subunit amino acid transport system ATPase component
VGCQQRAEQAITLGSREFPANRKATVELEMFPRCIERTASRAKRLSGEGL